MKNDVKCGKIPYQETLAALAFDQWKFGDVEITRRHAHDVRRDVTALTATIVVTPKMLRLVYPRNPRVNSHRWGKTQADMVVS